MVVYSKKECQFDLFRLIICHSQKKNINKGQNIHNTTNYSYDLWSRNQILFYTVGIPYNSKPILPI